MSQTAHRVEKRRLRRGNGLETLVDMVAITVMSVGTVVAMLCLLLLSWQGLALSGLVLVGSFFTWLLLRCLAEHLRLQKKIAGYEFEGNVSGPMEETIWACSLCGHMLHSDESCEACGARIVDDED